MTKQNYGGNVEPLRLSKDDLLKLYPDPEWREKMFEMSRLVDFLNGSILKEKYKIPDDVATSIHLTAFGNKVMQRLITKNDVPAKEARMLCLLKLVHREPLVDLDKTNVADIQALIDKQMQDRDLLFPYIMGRALYDQAASLFEDARDILTHRDTLRLLDGLPIGVFQSGPFVSGPYGLLRSPERRWFSPTITVPMYHCSELTCPVIHRTRLTSDLTAPINEHAPTLERVLDQFGEDESEWGEFIEALGSLEGLRFDDASNEPITLALADLLGDDELRSLLADVLDNSGGQLRSLVAPLGLVGKSDDIVEKLERAQLIQVLLLAPSKTLVTRIDKLVRHRDADSEQARIIAVAQGEVRRLRTNRRLGYGTFAIFPEISAFGIRFSSNDFDLAPMRLKRLVEELYRMDDHAEVDELQWQLRDIEGDDPHEQLEEYVRSVGPDEVVERLILARRTNQILACEKLGLDFEGFSDDRQFVEAILWKLGFYNDNFDDRNRDFWSHHDRLKRYAQTAGVGARVDAVELRSRAVNYFVELEGVLDDALAYSTWALTNDHLRADQPFAYNPVTDRAAAFARLNSHEMKRGAEEEVIRLGDTNTLYPLIRGFGILADLLAGITDNGVDHLRSIEDYPRYSAFTDLKKFPFLHTTPFLDLLPRSRKRIVETLGAVRSTLEGANVHLVRNDYMHYRASATDLPRLDVSLNAAEMAVSRLEADGMCRLLFGLVGDAGDGWDRRVYTLRNARRREVAFARPSAFDWNRMPSLRGLQYVMPAAVFARPNEMLRFTPVFDTEYAKYWGDYPRRRGRRSAIGAKGALASAN